MFYISVNGVSLVLQLSVVKKQKVKKQKYVASDYTLDNCQLLNKLLYQKSVNNSYL